MKIAYFGTGEFSKNILKSLIDSKKLDIKLVVSQQDKPVGRKKIIQKTPVKILAEEHGIEVAQPKSLKKDQDFLEKLKNLELDFIIVVAYGKIMPESLLTIPKYGSINVHGSLLPSYRGASPIQEAIKNGDTTTGVTIMYMSKVMDEGDMLAKKEVTIDRDDTSMDIFTKFEAEAPELLLSTLEKIKNNLVSAEKQDDTQASYCTKIQKQDGKVDFQNQTAKQIYDTFRAYTPWPGVYHYYEDKKLQFTSVDYLELNFDDEELLAGDVIELYTENDEKNKQIGVIAKDGVLIINKVKLEGKKEMDIKDFINGNKEFLDYSFIH